MDSDHADRVRLDDDDEGQPDEQQAQEFQSSRQELQPAEAAAAVEAVAADPPAGEAPPMELDQAKVGQFIAELKLQQNMVAGSLAGFLAAGAGAAAWGAITAATGYQIGYMAIGVGILVGFAVRALGRGIDKQFGVIGAVFALLGCAAGNVFATCIFAASELGIPLMQLLAGLDLEVISDILIATFEPIDLLFYGLAVYAGYHFAFRRISEEEMMQLATGNSSQDQS